MKRKMLLGVIMIMGALLLVQNVLAIETPKGWKMVPSDGENSANYEPVDASGDDVIVMVLPLFPANGMNERFCRKCRFIFVEKQRRNY